MSLNRILLAIAGFSILNVLLIIISNVPCQEDSVSPVSSAFTRNIISQSTNSSLMWTTTQMTITHPKLLLTSRFAGMLGSQMFIYASIIGLARAQDREPFVSNGGFLQSLFQISYIRRNIYTNGWSFIGESNYATFDSKLMKLPQQNLMIFGYMQCWRYFQHSQKEIRSEFTFKADIQKRVQTILATYRSRRENHVLVGVHVRRGDFLASKHVKDGYGVANVSYFVNAFATMRSLLTNQNITFLVGSDYLDWCKNNLNDSDIEILPEGSPDEHFSILSSCAHTIITGGTFGWWIGWLANGITIYYKNYVTEDYPTSVGFNEIDYYPQGWIAME